MQVCISQIGNGLCGCAEVRGRFRPTHWQREGECHEGPFTRTGWEEHSEVWYVVRMETDPIESVCEIDLRYVCGPQARVCGVYLSEDAMERATELHGLFWRPKFRVLVHSEIGVVDDDARPSIPLWHQAYRTEAQGGEVAHLVGR